jgi:ArsR family transcriptional regulator
MNKSILKIFKALSDDTRIAIVRELVDVKEMTCQELMKKFLLSQPTLSHHFNKLVDAGILDSKKNGVLWIYQLRKSHLKKMGIDIKKIIENV